MPEHADLARRPAPQPEAGAEAAHLGAVPAVAQLAETGHRLNAGPAVAAQRALAERLSAPVQRAAPPAPNGLPRQLKAGIEALSGVAMDDVRVHRNSSKPAQLQAHAYAQGSDIHLAPGQDHHLPHEAWHVVQQKQGRVRPTMQLKAGTPVNDDAGLEREADRMGAKAAAGAPAQRTAKPAVPRVAAATGDVAQRRLLVMPTWMKLSATTRAVHFSEGSLDARFWKMTLPNVYENRSTLMAAIAVQAAAIGNNVQKQVTWANKSGKTVEHWVYRASEAGTDTFNFQPVRAAFTGTYKVASAKKDTPPEQKTLEIDYHFGSNAAGYVVRVHDSANKAAKNMVFTPARDITDPNEFSSTHASHGATDSLSSRTGDADAAAKVTGEGARWAAVARNAGKITDTSTLFTNEVPGKPFTTDMKGIQFRDLYLTWKSAFGKRYGIPDSAIVAVLQGAKVAKSAGNGDIDLLPIASSSLDMARDICLDNPAATANAGLEPRAVMKLSHVATVNFGKDFAEQATAVTTKFNTLVTAFGETGYAAGGIFTFGAVTKGKPEAVGADKTLTVGTTYRFPAYREKAKSAEAQKKITLTAGTTAFDTERKTKYTALIGTATTQLEHSLKAPAFTDAISMKTRGTLTATLTEKVKAKFQWSTGPLPAALLADDQRKTVLDTLSEDFVKEEAKAIEQEKRAPIAKPEVKAEVKPLPKPVVEAPIKSSAPKASGQSPKQPQVPVKPLTKSQKRRARLKNAQNSNL